MARDRKLNSEDRILWGKVARSTRPMPGRLEDLIEFEAAFIEPEPENKAPPSKKVPVSLAEKAAQAEAAKKDRRVHHPFERPVKRKLSRGHLPLEARVDLHGLYQSEAHGVLLDFLMRAHDRGMRHVLVITGKGSSMGSEGALKRAVPLWFSKPEFRNLISSYEPAAQKHGGEGAMYIRLARHRGENR
ncbi:Smr/MutS family protein [Agrobacterium sp. ES01]|uniref:Smr/MutS family protein n=1 Tax=Agrobacterium sp. ES01 TaxID=3420714 RepID=UPI003D0D2596